MEEWNAMLNQQSGSGKTGGVATGDSANILLWGTALILGAAGLVDANKKRKNEDNKKYLYLASTRALHKLNIYSY